jgi:hypothetical protein
MTAADNGPHEFGKVRVIGVKEEVTLLTYPIGVRRKQ